MRRSLGAILSVLFAVPGQARAQATPAAPELHPGEGAPGGLRFSLSFGAGTAYDVLGGRIEAASDHFGAFVGVGAGRSLAAVDSAQLSQSSWGFSAGGRWYRDVRRGFFVSLAFLYASSTEYLSQDAMRWGSGNTSTSTTFTAGAVAGWRWGGEHLYFEAGAGGFFYQTQRGTGCDDGAGTCSTQAPAPQSGVFPDLVLGVGFEL
jgi:hypothetical protein